MTLSVVFWLLMFIWLILGLIAHWPQSPDGNKWRYGPVGSVIIVFLLFGVIGWKIFGSPIKDY